MDGKVHDVLVIGGGPAGLRAAELVSAAGWRTILADHKPSVGRKFLVAGRGGLNLTHSEPLENFPSRYGTENDRWRELLHDFSPENLRTWTMDIGVETFVGTSKRVFPVSKQAAPLLRRWIARLKKQRVDFRMRHELKNFQKTGHGWKILFSTPDGESTVEARAVIFALGGASWPETGSDGHWVKLFSNKNIAVTPLAPTNCGYEVDWPEIFLSKVEGQPLKNIVVITDGKSIAGELLVTKYGLEGGALYQLDRKLRAMSQPEIVLDLKPSFTTDQLATKISSVKENFLKKAAAAWRLSPVALALLETRQPFESAGALAALVKSFPLPLRGPRPIEEAISSTGGVAWSELDDRLMLKKFPGLFCAGEMIDWDAPTGGYLLQGCFSTATRAARGVLNLLSSSC